MKKIIVSFQILFFLTSIFNLSVFAQNTSNSSNQLIKSNSEFQDQKAEVIQLLIETKKSLALKDEKEIKDDLLKTIEMVDVAEKNGKMSSEQADEIKKEIEGMLKLNPLKKLLESRLNEAINKIQTLSIKIPIKALIDLFWNALFPFFLGFGLGALPCIAMVKAPVPCFCVGLVVGFIVTGVFFGYNSK